MTKTSIFIFVKEHKCELEEKYGLVKIGLLGSDTKGIATEHSDVDLAISNYLTNLWKNL